MKTTAIAGFVLFAALLCAGCATTATNGTYIENSGYNYRYITYITDDAVSQITKVLPPAKTQINLANADTLSDKDLFGKSLINGLRQHGFAATTGIPDTDSSFLPLTYALSNLDTPNNFHVVINVGNYQFSRLYRADKAGNILPATMWTVRR